jgi:hypothetical protein
MHHGGQRAHTPGFVLWEKRVEEGEEGNIGQMHAAGDHVGHDVGEALDVGDFVEVAVVATVHARQATQVGPGVGGREGALVVA